MGVEVPSKVEQAMARLLSRPSLVGDSLLVRLRSGILGLLGLVAAIGLGLVGIVSQQGLPGLFNSPLPASPAPPLVQNETIALPSLAPDAFPTEVSAPRSRPAAKPTAGDGTTQSPASGLAGSRQVEAPTAQPAPAPPPAPAPAQVPDAGQDQPQGSAPTFVSTPTAAKPAPVSAAVEPDKTSSRRSGKSHGRPARSQGPPPWAENGGEDSDDLDDEGEDNDEHDDEHDDYDEHDDDGDRGDQDRPGKPDRAGG